MTAFAPSDVVSITVSPDQGGCGQLHAREITNANDKAFKKGEAAPEYAEGPFSIDCLACEPILIERHGWARNEHDVALTQDEIRTKERLEKEGTAATNAMAAELGRQLAEAARAGAGIQST